jgi:hypothetical protein
VVGMLQVLTYIFAFYLIIKGVQVLQIALSSNRIERRGIIVLGAVTLLFCILGAGVFVYMQEEQAHSLGRQVDH